MQRLHAAFPQHVAHILIHCDDRGNVTINGSVPTWNEKRTILQTLRDTPGCASMANHLTLTSVPAPVEGIIQTGGVPLTGGVVPAGGFSQTREPGTLESQRTADSAMRLEDAIQHLCPQAKNLHVVQIEPRRYPHRDRRSGRTDRQRLRRPHLRDARAPSLPARRPRQHAEEVDAVPGVGAAA